jgi:glutathione S-transferase
MQNQVQFYSFIVCPYAIRVRMALEELGISYDYHEVDLLTDQ